MAFRASGRPAIALLVLFLLTSGLPPSLALADMAAGREAFRAGDLPTAYRHFLEEAEAGRVEAQFLVGQMLANGQGMDRDIPNALDWLEQAAAGGHTGAQMMAGTIYAFGDGVPADYERALLLLTPAAEAGDALAQNNLAVLTFYGLGIPADPVQALAWTIRAERKGLIQAINFRQEIEKSVSPDQKRAAMELASKPLAGSDAAPAATTAATGTETPAPAPSAGAPAVPTETRVPSSVQAEALEPMPAAPEPEPEPAPPPVQSAAEEPAAPATPRPEPPPGPAVQSGDGAWSVQVAALPTAEEAKRQWAAISRRQSALLDGQPMEMVTAELGERGTFHRILVGRFASSGAAQEFCNRLKEAGQDCLIRKR